MKIPEMINKDDREYILVKKYPNFIMYKDKMTGSKECFKMQELQLILKKEKEECQY